MMRVYALDPIALSKDGSPHRVLMSFNKESGRYIAAIQDDIDWLRELNSLMQSRDAPAGSSMRARESVIEWIKAQKNTDNRKNVFFDTSKRKYDARRDWIENALAVHMEYSFDAVITENCESVKKRFESKYDVARIQDVHDVHEGSDWWKAIKSIKIERNSADYAEKLGSIVSSSGDILILDPYFEPERRYLDVLKALIQKANPRKALNVSIICADKNGMPAKDFLEKCEKKLRRYVSSKINISILRVKVNATERFHDRYILTDRMDVMIGYGVSEDPRIKSSTTAAVISEMTANEIKEWINDPLKFTPDLKWQ